MLGFYKKYSFIIIILWENLLIFLYSKVALKGAMIKVIDTKVRYQFISERLWRELSAHEDIFRIRRSMLLWNRCYLDLQMLSPTSVPIGYSDKGLVFGFKPLEAGSLTQFQRSGLKSLGLERLRRQGAWILISMYSKFWIYFYSSWCLRLGNIVFSWNNLYSFFCMLKGWVTLSNMGSIWKNWAKTWLTLRNSFCYYLYSREYFLNKKEDQWYYLDLHMLLPTSDIKKA